MKTSFAGLSVRMSGRRWVVAAGVGVGLLMACPSSTPSPATSSSSSSPSSSPSSPSSADKSSVPAPVTYPQQVSISGEIFASGYSVQIIVGDATAAARAATLQPFIDATLAEVERQLSAWRTDAELTRLSALPWTKPWPASPGTLAVVERCLEVSKGTDGAFDITISPLLDLWGFSAAAKAKEGGPTLEVPTAAAIAAARASVGWRQVHVGPGTITKDREDLVLDATAVTDGAAAAAVVTMLVERGFQNILVDVAGEVAVRGEGLKGPWRVGINTPDANAAPDDVLRVVPLPVVDGGGLTLSTSGTYRERRDIGATSVSHILDPRTGRPAVNPLVSCTIVGPDLVVGDALSTACIVLGEAGTRAALATSFPGYSALFVANQPGNEERLVTTTANFPDVEPSAP